MFTLCAESFDMMKADVMRGQCLSTSGMLVKSKIFRDCLFWQSCHMRDLLEETLATCATGQKPASLFETRAAPMIEHSVQQTEGTNPEQPDSGVSASVLDVLNKEIVWEYLSIYNAKEDGCEYCSLKPVEKQLFPKHHLYTNGTLTCPVLLAMKTAQRQKSGKSQPSRKKWIFRQGKPS